MSPRNQKAKKKSPDSEAPAQETPEVTENAAPEAPVQDECEKLACQLKEAQEKLVYMQADYQNFRKRTAKDISDARIYGAANALEPFITVYDYLTMAKTAAEKSDNIEQIRQGLSMIIDQYIKAFEESGVKKIATAGSPFDPALHEAVAKEPSDEIPEGFIIKEWSGGYQFGERLMRPAKVVVSTGPADSCGTEEE